MAFLGNMPQTAQQDPAAAAAQGASGGLTSNPGQIAAFAANPLMAAQFTALTGQAPDLANPLGTISSGLNSVTDALGLNNKFQAQAAPLAASTNPAQLAQAYANTQSGLSQQQALINALQAQGGIQNQSDVYNQYKNIAAGQGPNPAQAMLQQATGANIANQAALMAGQRGAAANPALIARQAAMQGANLQQQAAGQQAVMQANQQLGALGQMGNIAGQQVQNLGQSIGGYNQYALQGQGNLLQANAADNMARAQMQGNINTINAQVAAGNQKARQDLIGGIAKGAGAAAGMPMAHGGEVKSMTGKLLLGMAQGGQVPVMVSPGEGYVAPEKAKAVATGSQSIKQAGEIIPGKAKVKGDSLKNDTVHRKLEAGGVVVPRTVMQQGEDKAAEFVEAILRKNGRLN